MSYNILKYRCKYLYVGDERTPEPLLVTPVAGHLRGRDSPVFLWFSIAFLRLQSCPLAAQMLYVRVYHSGSTCVGSQKAYAV